MFDLPLHPVIVHFPIVLGIALPCVAFLIWWGIKKKGWSSRVWSGVVVLALVYTLTAAGAVVLGEADEERVEKVVSERVIEQHEEAGEAIPWIAGGLLLLAAAGFWFKNSHHARLALVVLSLAAIVPLVNTGHTGGKLVYQYGAATAHLAPEVRAALPDKGKMILASGEVHEVDEDEAEHADDD